MRRFSIVCTIVLLAVSCGGEDVGSQKSSPKGTTDSERTPTAISPLEGTWRTGPVSERDTKATLRKYGLGKWIKPLQSLVADPSADMVFTLKIHAGRWDLYGTSEGGTTEPLDYDANYEVDGNTVVASHEGESNTYRWSVDGETLTLRWLDTTYGSNEGIPEEVFQRALYMAAKFQKRR